MNLYCITLLSSLVYPVALCVQGKYYSYIHSEVVFIAKKTVYLCSLLNPITLCVRGDYYNYLHYVIDSEV